MKFLLDPSKYYISQLIIWFSVFIPLSFLPHWSGTNWAYSLAYGSLLPLAFYHSRFNKNNVKLLSLIGIAWFLARIVEALTLDSDSIIYGIDCIIYSVVFVLSITYGRHVYWVLPVIMVIYANRLASIDGDPTYWQSGLYNLIFASLILFMKAGTSKDEQAAAKSYEHQYRKAA